MKIYDEVKGLLEAVPNARERRFRSVYLTELTLKGEETINAQDFSDFARTYATYIRFWQAVQKDYPELRGKDSKDGKNLAQEKCIELGYCLGFDDDIKKLNSLTF